MSERHLAVAVIEQAITDFGGWPAAEQEARETAPETPTGKTPFLKLLRTQEQIEAGRFLLERKDRITKFWFHQAGIDLKWFRGLKPEWHERLRLLRSALTHYEQQHQKAAAADRARTDRQIAQSA